MLGPLGASWSALLASLSVLGASWEPLESVMERIGGVPVASRSPKGTSHGLQEEPKIVKKSIQNRIDFFNRFLDAMLIPKWSQNGSPNHPKAGQKSVPFFDRFFHRFFLDFPLIPPAPLGRPVV